MQKRSMPYEKYFGEMDLDEDEKKTRIELAKELEKVFWFMLSFIAAAQEAGQHIDVIELYSMTQRRYIDALSDKGYDVYGDYGFLLEHVTQISQDVVDVTLIHLREEYYTSRDRAMFIAENESQTVRNTSEIVEAEWDGATYKVWRSMEDKRVRRTHAEADGQIKPIGEPFEVGGSLMMYPKDESLGADPEEIVNCRCTALYY